jgi:hypothetical protein
LQIFSKVKEQQPKVMDKVTAVRGDVTMPQLGLSPSDLQLLIENVSVVFHSAATIRFNEELKTALVMNVKGPMELLEICRKMKHLVVANFCYRHDWLIHYQLILSISFRHLYTCQLPSTIWTGRKLRKRFTTIRTWIQWN